MNKIRRKQINIIINKLNACVVELENIKDLEDESRDNMPENLQNGDAYYYSDECSDKLIEAIDSINDVISELDTIV